MNLSYLIISFVIKFSLLMIAVSVHEFAHGWIAFKLGDNTAKDMGRLTLNPLAHIDPFGTVILPLLIFLGTQGRAIFGAAKPVPINYLGLKNPKQDMIWIGLAGPLANLLFAVALRLMLLFLGYTAPALRDAIIWLIVINVILCVFNLIPIPPLDGSRVVMGLLPRDLASNYAKIEPYGFFIIILLMFMGILWAILLPVISLILNLLGVGF